MQNFSLFADWNAKLSGSVDAGFGVRVTPVLKVQSGVPYGRFFQTRAGELNYGAQIILAEPIGTRRTGARARCSRRRRRCSDRASRS